MIIYNGCKLERHASLTTVTSLEAIYFYLFYLICYLFVILFSDQSKFYTKYEWKTVRKTFLNIVAPTQGDHVSSPRSAILGRSNAVLAYATGVPDTV